MTWRSLRPGRMWASSRMVLKSFEGWSWLSERAEVASEGCWKSWGWFGGVVLVRGLKRFFLPAMARAALPGVGVSYKKYLLEEKWKTISHFSYWKIWRLRRVWMVECCGEGVERMKIQQSILILSVLPIFDFNFEIRARQLTNNKITTTAHLIYTQQLKPGYHSQTTPLTTDDPNLLFIICSSQLHSQN